MAALREADRTAMRMAYIWYVPLLRDQARKLGVAVEERDELATTVLGDVVLHLQRSANPPRDFVRYLVGALRNRARNAHRDRQRIAQTQEYAYSDIGGGRERIVAECHSEYGIRSSAGAAGDAPLRSAIQMLAVMSADALGDDDLSLMVGLSHHVPLRELAEQGGITYGAARVRVHRMRERLHKLAMKHVASLEGEDRGELVRFLRRAGVTISADGSPRDVANREAPHDTE